MSVLNLFGPLDNFVDSFVDNVIRDKVQPEIGSVVYCDLLFGYAEHSGIYIGDGEIVALEKDGRIVARSTSGFMDGTTAISIYVSCHDGHAVGSEAAARRAREMIGSHRDYNVILDNCHQFTAGCLTGNFENSNNFLWMLKDKSQQILGSDEWRVWDR